MIDRLFGFTAAGATGSQSTGTVDRSARKPSFQRIWGVTASWPPQSVMLQAFLWMPCQWRPCQWRALQRQPFSVVAFPSGGLSVWGPFPPASFLTNKFSDRRIGTRGPFIFLRPRQQVKATSLGWDAGWDAAFGCAVWLSRFVGLPPMVALALWTSAQEPWGITSTCSWPRLSCSSPAESLTLRYNTPSRLGRRVACRPTAIGFSKGHSGTVAPRLLNAG